MATAALTQNFFERHAEKIDFNGPRGCWLWVGAKSTKGYGRVGARGKLRKAHRVAYEAVHGPGSANGLVVRHKCDTPACVNPDHLELGTDADNMCDKMDRGRHRCDPRRGAAHGMAKLTEDNARSILADYVLGSRTHGTYALGRKYGVHPSVIGDIVNRKTWTHI